MLFDSFSKDTLISCKRAFILASVGAGLGCPHSKGVLGCCYAFGRGVTKDETRGFDLGMQSSLAGSVIGHFLVGMCYDSGCGVVADKHLAKRWFRAEIESLRVVFEMNKCDKFDCDSIEHDDGGDGDGEEEEEEEEEDEDEDDDDDDDDRYRYDDDDDDERDPDNLAANFSDSSSPISSLPPQPSFETDNLEYADYFLGKSQSIEFKNRGHIEDALVLAEAFTCICLRRIDSVLGRSKPLVQGYLLSEWEYYSKYRTSKPKCLPRPTFIYMESTFSQPLRVRSLMGFTSAACRHLAAPRGLNVYAKTLKSWTKKIMIRVLSVLESKAQVMQCLARFFTAAVFGALFYSVGARFCDATHPFILLMFKTRRSSSPQKTHDEYQVHAY
jgi:hypothetical protein